jgi:hypothetical protein
MSTSDAAPIADVAPPTPLLYLGAAAAAVSTFLPWVKFDDESMTAWEMPLMFLSGRENDLGGPKVGLLVLLFLACGLASALMRVANQRRVTIALAVVVVELVALTLLRVRALDLDPSVGTGVIVAVVGGLMLAFEVGVNGDGT